MSVLLAKLLFLGVILCYIAYPLAPDEAQYWTWSRDLGAGYYSKPPGIAWLIACGTYFLGHTEFAIRFPSLLISTLTSYLLYRAGMKSGLKEKSALYMAIAFTFTPIAMMGSVSASTDVGMMFFWVLALNVVVSQYTQPSALSRLGVVFSFLGGGIFKWAMFWMFPFLWLKSAYSYIGPKLKWNALLGVILSLLPVIWWNMDHDFVTFRHVWSQSHVTQSESQIGKYFFSFIGSQLGVVSPLLFLWLIWAFFKGYKLKEMPKPVIWQFQMVVSLTAVVLVVAFLKKVQGNWFVFIYPSAFIVAASMTEKLKPKYLKSYLPAATFLSFALSMVVLLIPYYQLHGSSIPYKFNFLRHSMGWDFVEEMLDQQGFNPDKHFLIGDKYQIVSELNFYSPGGKEGKTSIYFMNLFNRRSNHFSLIPIDPSWKGKSAYYVGVENQSPEVLKSSFNGINKKLSKYFKKVKLVGTFPIFSVSNQPVKSMILVRGEGYLGNYESIHSGKY